MIMSTQSRITKAGKSRPETNAATLCGTRSSARIQMYRLDRAMMIITLALVRIESRIKGGISFILSPRITKAPIMKAYRTPIPADSVAVAIPNTTAPTTKTGIIRARRDWRVRSIFSRRVSLISSRGYFFQYETPRVIPSIRKPIITPGIKLPRKSLPTDSSATRA